MEQRGEETHTTETEVSGGSKENVVRWVLIIGTILAIVFLTLIWTTGAFLQPDGPDSQTSVSNTQLEAQSSEAARDVSIAPAMGEDTATPSATATPGDAPAGDPKNTAN